MQKVYKFLKNKYKYLLIGIFSILFLIGLCFIPHINGNFDENLEQNILLGNVKDYFELSGLEELSDSLNEKGIISISESSEKDHGMAPYYLFTPVLTLRNYSMHYTSILWHLYTYLIFFLGTIFIYKLTIYLFKSKKVSIISTLLYFISPRILIDSLHNNKDIILMSLLIIMIYYGLKFIKEKRYRYAVAFAIVSAFVCNIKILGLFFLFILGVGYIIHTSIEKKWNKHNFLCGLLAAVMSVVLFIILTPAIWGTGSFKLFDYVNYCLTNSVNFRGSITVLFEGVRYNHDSNPLPWYYLPKMMTITLPIILIILYLLSLILFFIRFVKSIKNRKISFQEYSYLIIFIIFLVPFMIAITSKPNIYNGWRHFYFLYGLIIIFSSFSINYILNIKEKKLVYIFYSIVIITIVINIFYLFKYGVANTAYYNILAGRNNLSHIYELDYYNVTSIDALHKLEKSSKYEVNDDGHIYLYGSGFNNRIITDICTNSSKYLKDKIIVVTDDNIEKYLKENKIIYSLNNSVYSYIDMSKYEHIYSYKIFNSNIISFYKLNKNILK